MQTTSIVWLGLLLLVLGCSTKPSIDEPAVSADSPLTVDQWKALPPVEKFDAETLQRLREHDDALRSERAWRKFEKEVVAPELRKDIPLQNHASE